MSSPQALQLPSRVDRDYTNVSASPIESAVRSYLSLNNSTWTEWTGDPDVRGLVDMGSPWDSLLV